MIINIRISGVITKEKHVHPNIFAKTYSKLMTETLEKGLRLTKIYEQKQPDYTICLILMFFNQPQPSNLISL